MRAFACKQKVLEYAGGHQLGVLDGQKPLQSALHRQYLIAKYGKSLGTKDLDEYNAK